MPSATEHAHRIRIHPTQMEMPSYATAYHDEDYERKLQDAQEELQRIQQQREELERKKQELEELTARKRAFVSQQVELTERFTTAVTMIDRTLYEIREEMEDLEQCRVSFASHLDKIQKLNPDNWTRDTLHEKLERATVSLELAAEEYDQAAAHFEGTRAGTVFGKVSRRGRIRGRAFSGEFVSNLRNGLAFNLPLLLLGGAALAVYWLK